MNLYERDYTRITSETEKNYKVISKNMRILKELSV